MVFGLVVATDWVDGTIARRTGQVTGARQGARSGRRQGRDRRRSDRARRAGSVPGWAAALILVRDVSLLAGGRGRCCDAGVRIDVRWIGKIATFALMIAIPAISWGSLGLWPSAAALAIGWLAYVGGIVQYYIAAGAYARRRARAIAASAARPERSTTMRSPGALSCDVEAASAAAAADTATREEAHGGVPRGASVHEGARVGARRGGRVASASPTSRRTRSATSSTSTCPQVGARVEANAAVRRGRIDEVGVRCLQSGRRHDRRAEPADRGAARAGQRAAVRRRMAGGRRAPTTPSTIEGLLDADRLSSVHGRIGTPSATPLVHRDFTRIDRWSSLMAGAGRGLVRSLRLKVPLTLR